jgi:hypothetical protein
MEAVMKGYDYALVELWDADFGWGQASYHDGALREWTGLRGTPARPLTTDMTRPTSGFSGYRASYSFNGTTQGLLAELPSFSRTCQNVTICAHIVPADNTTTPRVIASVGKSTDNRLVLYHGTLANYVGVYGNGEDGTLLSSTGWGTTERVLSAARSATHLYGWLNGSSLGSQAVATTSPLGAAGSLGIGVNQTFDTADWFSGHIRRIAVYSEVHTNAQALAIANQWIGT